MLVVDGINMVKKHTKPNPLKGATGGIVAKDHADSPVQRGHFQCGHRQG